MAVMYKSRKVGGGGPADFSRLTMVASGVVTHTIQDAGLYFCVVGNKSSSNTSLTISKNNVAIGYLDQSVVEYRYSISGSYRSIYMKQSSGFVECSAGDIISFSPGSAIGKIYKYG